MKNSDRPQRPRKPRAAKPDAPPVKDPWRDNHPFPGSAKQQGEEQGGKKSFKKSEARGSARTGKNAGDKTGFREKRPFNGSDDTERKAHPKSDRPFRKEGSTERPKRRTDDRKESGGFRERGSFDKSGRPGRTQEDRPQKDRPLRKEGSGDRPPRRDKARDEKGIRSEGKRFEKKAGYSSGEKRPVRPSQPNSERPAREAKSNERKPHRNNDAEEQQSQNTDNASGSGMTLNKYLAHAGLSSRRDAAEVIKEGKVKVNGEVLTTPGYRVQPGDKITFEGKRMAPQAKKVYVLLNKPKGFITTTDDEQGRRTVMELVQAVEAERIFPVGRLDRNTTGLLLLTNDGDLAQRLTHPKYEAKKIYQVGLDKPLTAADFDKLMAGVQLEDGIAKPDKLAYLEDKSELGIEIHSGKNRIVRRMFEALGYEVVKLDRVMFAGLTKKNIPRGQWRHLTEQEIVRLKHFKAER